MQQESEPCGGSFGAQEAVDQLAPAFCGFCLEDVWMWTDVLVDKLRDKATSLPPPRCIIKNPHREFVRSHNCSFVGHMTALWAAAFLASDGAAFLENRHDCTGRECFLRCLPPCPSAKPVPAVGEPLPAIIPTFQDPYECLVNHCGLGDYRPERFTMLRIGGGGRVEAVLSAADVQALCTGPWVAPDQTRYTWLHGVVHSLGDEPAIVGPHGDRQWYKHGALHRDGDLPALVRPDIEIFSKDGLKHRTTGPAVTCRDGTKQWFVRDLLESPGDAPAVLLPDGTKMWYRNNALHRDSDLPAIEYGNGAKRWMLHGVQVRTSPDLPSYTDANVKVWTTSEGAVCRRATRRKGKMIQVDA